MIGMMAKESLKRQIITIKASSRKAFLMGMDFREQTNTSI
jgi:hypothetical protein